MCTLMVRKGPAELSATLTNADTSLRPQEIVSACEKDGPDVFPYNHNAV